MVAKAIIVSPWLFPVPGAEATPVSPHRLLGFTGRAAAFALVFLKERPQFAYELRLFSEAVAPLGKVFAQVEKLAGLVVAAVTALVLQPPGFSMNAVVIAAGGIDQHPISLSDREFTPRAMMHGGFARGNRTPLAEQQG